VSAFKLRLVLLRPFVQIAAAEALARSILQHPLDDDDGAGTAKKGEQASASRPAGPKHSLASNGGDEESRFSAVARPANMATSGVVDAFTDAGVAASASSTKRRL
jgi:hypothetical protein